MEETTESVIERIFFATSCVFSAGDSTALTICSQSARINEVIRGRRVVSSQVGLWRSWERASMAWKRSSVRSRPGPPNASAISVFDSSDSGFISSLTAFHCHRSRPGYEPENRARMLTDEPQDEHFRVTNPPISGNQTSFVAPQLRQRICAGDGLPYCSSTFRK